MVEQHFIVCIYHILPTYSSLDEYLGHFHVWAIMSNVAIHIHVQNFIWTYLFTSLRYTARYITMFNHLRNCRLFSKAASPSYIPSSSLRVQISPYPDQHLLSNFLILATVVGMKWYLIVLNYICLMTNDVEHLSTCLLAICFFSLEKFPTIFNGSILSFFYYWVVGGLYIF